MHIYFLLIQNEMCFCKYDALCHAVIYKYMSGVPTSASFKFQNVTLNINVGKNLPVDPETSHC
jgi:hypothetical protein